MSRVSEVQICKSAAATPGDKLKSSSCVRERLPHMQHVFLLRVCVCMNFIYPRVFFFSLCITAQMQRQNDPPAVCSAGLQPVSLVGAATADEALFISPASAGGRGENPPERGQRLARFPRVLAALAHIKTQRWGIKTTKKTKKTSVGSFQNFSHCVLTGILHFMDVVKMEINEEINI